MKKNRLFNPFLIAIIFILLFIIIKLIEQK